MDQDEEEYECQYETTEVDKLVSRSCKSRTFIEGTRVDGKAKDVSWASSKSLRILSLCSVIMFVASGVPHIHYSFIILFFQNGGASTMSISAYNSCMNVFILVTSLLSGRINQEMNMKKMLVLSVIFLCGSTCVHGTFVLIQNVSWQIVLGVMIRAVQGVSATLLQLLAVSILIQKFPNNSGRVAAVNETAMGLGYSLSPLIGSLIYERFGFLWTFLIPGGSGCIMVLSLLTTSRKNIQTDSTTNLSDSGTVRWNDALFFSPLVIYGLTLACETCFEYVIALYICDVYGETTVFTGTVLGAFSLSSTLFSILIGYFCDKMNPFLIGLIGSFLASVGFIAMVPPPLFRQIIPQSKYILLCATVFTGLGQAMVWLHVMPAMLFVKTRCQNTPMSRKLSNLVSLLYIVSTSVGEIVGSFIAGGLLVWVSYWTLFAILSGTMMLCVPLGIVAYAVSAKRARATVPYVQIVQVD